MKARLWLVVALCLTLFMPSDDSIWIDEAQTAAYAQEPTLHAWAERLAHDKFSEAQMPLSMGLFWMAEKILGHGEWRLRAINILFTCATITMIWLIGVRFRAPALALIAAVNPFIWSYTNEARPYALQIAGGAALLLAGLKIIQRDDELFPTVALWAVAVWTLCVSSMLGVIPAFVGSIWLALLLVRQKRNLSPFSWGLVGLTTILLLLLGFYYLRTLQRGTGGAMLWPVSSNNLIFSGYEMLGFAGLGPSRQALREAFATGAVFSAIKPYLIPLLFFGLANLVLVLSALAWFFRGRNRELVIFLSGLPLISAALLFLLARLVHFPFWGRHLAPVVAFIIVGLALPALIDRRRLVICVWSLLCFASAMQLRLAPRHAKDDNRSAARIALQALAEGKEVWWSADQRAAEYYGVRFGDKVTLAPQVPERLPDTIVTSKPDVFDRDGEVAEYLRRNNYHPDQVFQAMTIWRR